MMQFCIPVVSVYSVYISSYKFRYSLTGWLSISASQPWLVTDPEEDDWLGGKQALRQWSTPHMPVRPSTGHQTDWCIVSDGTHQIPIVSEAHFTCEWWCTFLWAISYRYIAAWASCVIVPLWEGGADIIHAHKCSVQYIMHVHANKEGQGQVFTCLCMYCNALQVSLEWIP